MAAPDVHCKYNYFGHCKYESTCHKNTYMKLAQTFPVGPRTARRGTPTCADILRTSTSVSLVINAPIFIEKIRAT